MNMLTNIEKAILSRCFDNQGGVLDFTNARFDAFTMDSVGIPIQGTYQLSKGKSLAEFVRLGESDKIGLLFESLVKYYREVYCAHNAPIPDLDKQLPRVLEIAGKYSKGVGVTAVVPLLKKINSAYVREMSERAQKDVSDGYLDSALTKARTLLEEAFCFVIEKKGAEPSKSGDLNDKYKQVKDLYRMHQCAEYDKRFNGMLSGGMWGQALREVMKNGDEGIVLVR